MLAFYIKVYFKCISFPRSAQIVPQAARSNINNVHVHNTEDGDQICDNVRIVTIIIISIMHQLVRLDSWRRCFHDLLPFFHPRNIYY